MLKKKIILILFIFTTLISCSVFFDSYKSEIDDIYIPENLKESIKEVDKFYTDSLKTEIKTLTENEYLANSHFGTGFWIRNNWGLWKGSRLSRYFKRKGINHPDDISSIILKSYHRQLTGKNIDLKEQIKYYKDYWKESKKIGKLVELPSISDFPEKELEFGEAMWYENENNQSLIHIQTNSKTDSLWIYDYLYGWKKISNDLKIKLDNSTKYKTDSLMNIIYYRFDKTDF
ncbi:hypothetical protein SAMN05444411_11610 [Lutibacter oricola]|uniref:DUF6794 domain-containing protein n=1 Tax=Lutibacter oricola TaxID=762486 RepID=A0A1H3GQX5_9FLAO|nr:DUF6794 domain-containing protein [Lutibacter oricola]SDY05723.1 hypothetical protein SAMN05444411_11610 [Lutibacter oricola]